MFHLRVATHADVPALGPLIAASVRGLSAGFYSSAQVESALVHVFGPDTQLIADGTYFVVEQDGALVASGGWSRRRTAYGGDQMKGDEDPLIDPTRDAARIRAFFVHPAWARRGLARMLYDACVTDAAAAGFRRLELVATLPGEPLYAALGFTVADRFSLAMPDGVELPLARMTRALDDARIKPAAATDAARQPARPRGSSSPPRV